VSVHIVEFSTDVEQVPEVETAIADLFTAIEEAAPTGIDYSATRVAETRFLLVMTLEDEQVNPLTAIPEAVAFRAGIAEWAGGPTPPLPGVVLGRYAR